MAAHKDFDLSSLANMDTAPATFTTVSHSSTYRAIDPARPELAQAGRTVLITGGGTNIGKAIATAFTTAHAKTVIIVSRNKAVLDAAVEELKSYATSIESPTTFLSRSVDVSKDDEVVGLWDWLAAEAISIDILVLNAAYPAEAKLLHNLGIETLWREFEVNVKGALHFAEKFQKQKDFFKSPKTLLHLTTGAIHMLKNPIVAVRPSYPLTKSTATFAIMQIADAYKPDQLQVLNFHPGMLYGDDWRNFGITEDMLPFDSVDLPGSFAVWAASKEAHFLHGRYVAANWDVDELRTGDFKKHLEENPDYLRLAIVGVRDTGRAY
ncbi:NADP(+)-dependent dehydrogenase [Sporothrix brasiliensis 5110]|uniref:NADP(+)-dependent dehydrogenase n=1 Tax=Sporothrix brasiliensis 5110 TaxID=1398154 RepID=A0A0C2FF77_9PEZI|nr:NADP(+)-dependent dehydrogenase [Sporothrix brasiliensis 5110]KIH89758.1 NADP(+)-dependent dehydrogenase [Sporothrix brasiliensis 5110]